MNVKGYRDRVALVLVGLGLGAIITSELKEKPAPYEVESFRHTFAGNDELTRTQVYPQTFLGLSKRSERFRILQTVKDGKIYIYGVDIDGAQQSLLDRCGPYTIQKRTKEGSNYSSAELSPEDSTGKGKAGCLERG